MIYASLNTGSMWMILDASNKIFDSNLFKLEYVYYVDNWKIRSRFSFVMLPKTQFFPCLHSTFLSIHFIAVLTVLLWQCDFYWFLWLCSLLFAFFRKDTEIEASQPSVDWDLPFGPNEVTSEPCKSSREVHGLLAWANQNLHLDEMIRSSLLESYLKRLVTWTYVEFYKE